METDRILDILLERLGGQYKKIEYLGGGGVSKVYLVWHTILEEERALKMMDYNFLLRDLKKEKPLDIKIKFNKIRERFVNEAKTIYERISHPNIVKMHDVGFVKDEEKGIEVPYLIRDYIEGKSLEEIISHKPLDLTTIFKVSKDILSALSAIHEKKIIHRDIKPGNIMINEKNKSAILIDFELAKDMLNEVSLTTTGEPIGTPLYMAPEQFDDSMDETPETDIYSFGIILYEMLSGEVPFKVGNWPKLMNAHIHGKVPNVRDKNPDLPEGIENIIFKAMAKKPNDRYRSAEEFWTALSKVEETQKASASKDKKGIEVEGKKKKEKRKQKDKKRIKKDILIGTISIIVTIIGIVVGILTLFNPFQSKNNLVLQKGYIESANKFIQDGDFGKATEALNKAKEIKNTEEVRKLSETIANMQRENMRSDLDKLKAFLNGDTGKSEKVSRCREFLNSHKNVPQNAETISMVFETEKNIKHLEADIKDDEQYRIHINAVKKSIGNEELQKAYDELEKAGLIKLTHEIYSLSRTIKSKQRQKMQEDFGRLKTFLTGKAANIEKINQCNEFKRKHSQVPGNKETRVIISEITTIIAQLEAEINADMQYKKHITSAEKQYLNGNYERAISELKEAKKIKDTLEIKELSAKIKRKQIDSMKTDFGSLKIFLKGTASNSEKVEECRKFLEKHKTTPINIETKRMVNETNSFISQLQDKIRADDQYKKHIKAVKEFIRKGDIQQAINELEKAKTIKDTDEVRKLSETIANKQRENMRNDFEKLKTFLKGTAANDEKKNRCIEFLDKHKSVPPNDETRSMVAETKRLKSQFEAEINADKQYNQLINAAKRYIQIQDYEKADRALKDAQKIKDTKELKELSDLVSKKLEYERKHGTKEYKAIKDKLNLNRYLQFKRKYPRSDYLPDLKERLKLADKTLPPEKYWDKSIERNSKDYYEFTFGKEHNEHTMIYIPEKGFWIDKYEVSWGQFRKFLRAEKIKAPPIEDTEYIRDGDEFPAVVAFEEAIKYCRRYGLRLPGLDEWEYAAGKGKFIYPWGNESPIVSDIDGNWRGNFDTLDGDTDKDGYKGTAPVKSFEKFTSPFGIFNMAGNVWEWTKEKALKGGGYLSSEDDLRIKSSRKGESYDKEGFRCVKVEK